jgi:NTE family protein
MDQVGIFEGARQFGVLRGLRQLTLPAEARRGRESHVPQVRIGLALGGGFARGIAHAGILKVLEQHHIPIHCVTGVSAGSIVAAAYASGTTPGDIARAGCSMRFSDVGRWSLGRLGLVGSERMNRFLKRLLKTYRFEEMRIPLGVVTTDLSTGESVPFAGTGTVFDAIRASCSYPGLFQPVRHRGRLLVDGAMSMEVPAALARQLGATHVISVHLPTGGSGAPPTNLFQVLNRCFQILQSRSEDNWRNETDLVIAPNVHGVDWDAFGCGPQLIEAGEAAALAALPKIEEWMQPATAPRELMLAV